MDNNERVELKRAELMKSFELMPPEKLKVASDLIDQAAFLAVALEDLAEIISKEGMTEEYTNGANQSGRKISSNAKMYSALIGKYSTIVAKLLKIVPPMPVNRDREKELLRKLEEKERRREDAYAQALYDAFIEACRRGEAQHEHYTDFAEEWQANNPYNDFVCQEG